MSYTLTPQQALACLKEGNERMVRGRGEYPRLDPEQLKAAARSGQHPFATVVGCSDSRCPVELFLGAGVGDVFVIRVAGNVCATDEIASIEYSTSHLGSPLVVVMGHTHCGAVTAAASGGDVAGGCIPLVLEQIAPAVKRARAENPGATPEELIGHAVRHNVWQVIENLFTKSPLVCRSVREGDVAVVGAVLDIETGRVEWLGEHPSQAGLCMH